MVLLTANSMNRHEPGTRSMERTPSVSDSLLNRVAAGEMAAMQECINQYGGLVWSLARRFSASAADAEDAVQEVFITLWKYASRFDESKGSETTFVSMIARRRLIDRLRRTRLINHRLRELEERQREQTDEEDRMIARHTRRALRESGR